MKNGGPRLECAGQFLEKHLSTMDPLCSLEAVKKVGCDILKFTSVASHLTLRKYQKRMATAIVDLVVHGRGLTFVVIYPRQSGKNELQAQIETYLLSIFSLEDAEIVKVSPTWRPQSLNAMGRLRRVLDRNMLTLFQWSRESGYIYRVGQARIFFLSGSRDANVVGATASILLECDEAQDVLPAKWDKDFAPMCVPTNATRVFWGTCWTSRTLLTRELRAAQAAEKSDGIRRVFLTGANTVSKEVEAYGKFVEEQVARFGRQHPLVKTQLFSEEIDGEGGMFPARRLALLAGSHPRIDAPRAEATYALLIDVAGEDEGITGSPADSGEAMLANPRRDSTALTVVEVDLSGLADPFSKAPRYKIVDRRAWISIKHAQLFGEIRALAEHWRARYLVVDATGVGAGLASFLDKALPGKVIPFVFNASTKSRLGWEVLGLIETGRLKDYACPGRSATQQKGVPAGGRNAGGAGATERVHPDQPNPAIQLRLPLPGDKEQDEFNEQLQACQMEITPGPERRMKWGVPDGSHSEITGIYLHDDWVVSAALAAILDEQEWVIHGATMVVDRPDPLLEMDREGF